MKKAFKIVVMTIGALLVTAGNSQASIIYEKVELFQTEVFVTDTFEIVDAGSYTATLTDFEFPAPMAGSSLSVTAATGLLLGSLMAPGSFIFNATPGQHVVSVFGQADTNTSIQLGQYGIEIRQTSAVPEPGTLALLCFSLAGFGFTRRRIKT